MSSVRLEKILLSRRAYMAFVWIANPPVNALSHAVRQQLQETILAVNDDPQIIVAALIGEGNRFIAGADIREFGQPSQPPRIYHLARLMEDSSKIWLAAIQGFCLGGGFEIALGCHYRIAHCKTQVALPEIRLGLIPGSGGTTRLPRLISMTNAVHMVITGQHFRAQQALQLGAIDRVSSQDLTIFTKRFAQEIMSYPPPVPLSKRVVKSYTSQDFWAQLRHKLQHKYSSPFVSNKPTLPPQLDGALESLANNEQMSFSQALKRERQIFIQLRKSKHSQALRQVFFAERKIRKIPLILNMPPRPIKYVSVLGGGTMGVGIAAALLLAGFHTSIYEQNKTLCQQAYDNVAQILASSVRKTLINQTQQKLALSSLNTYASLEHIHQADLVIEAVTENLQLKQQLFEKVTEYVSGHTILTTNTSYLSVHNIFSLLTSTQHVNIQERTLGLHFFAPAHIMKLVEVIKTKYTSTQTLSSVFAVLDKLGKIGVLAGDCKGFIANRILMTYRQQANLLLLYGCLPQHIDQAMRDFGMSMGPYETQDLSGLHIAQLQRQTFKTPDPIPDMLCQQGRLGQKVQRGWYFYAKNSRTPIPDQTVTNIIEQVRKQQNISPQSFSPKQIQQYILYPMINEAACILDENMSQSPMHIDMVMLHGFAFPRHQGGLLYYADNIGLPNVLSFLEKIDYPIDYPISPLLQKLVSQRKDFSTFDSLT